MKLAELEIWLMEQLAAAVNVDKEQITKEEPFLQLGLDSVSAVMLTGTIEEKLGRTCSPTLFYDYPTITQLAAYLIQESSAERQNTEERPAREYAPEEDIAIVGLSCRFPGADSAEQFWENLLEGRQSITEIPSSRWNADDYYSGNPEEKGTMYTRWGGFLERIREFDAGFFGISPLEAEVMDPQQRLLMEQSWLAFEDAGVKPSELENQDVGVFIGISTNDYSKLQHQPQRITAYHGTGNASSIAANRLSYFYNLTGPSLALDTACSSSLVALHQACRSMKEGESSMALVGGVNLMLHPDLYINFSRARMMSESGRCHTFDSRADGYVRGEGCGMVVLRKLSEARERGDRIYAVIKGSAVNQDGRSNGLTAPRGTSQQKVVERALAAADLKAEDIGYIEAHGTGTKLGDPIEVNALKEVFAGKQEGICHLGAVKANIGHLEAAAGIAGLIKICLMFQNGRIVPHPDLQTVNEHIDLTGTPFHIPVESVEWKDKVKNAGISSFGFGGTNAHVIVQSFRAPRQLRVRPKRYSGHILTLSAKSESSLRLMQEAYGAAIEQAPASELVDLCYTAHCRRELLPYRLTVTGRTREELCSRLKAREGTPVSRIPGKIAFVYGGQGSQYTGMARELLQTSEVFQQAFSHALSYLDQETSALMMQILYGKEESVNERLHQTEFTQLSLFLIQYALTKLWNSFGITPDYVTGHSIGEYAAACQAGLLELGDAVKLVQLRGRLMGNTPVQGGMAMVQCPEETVRQLIQEQGLELSIAAVNTPDQTVVSGVPEHLQKLEAMMTDRSVMFKQLLVSNAFHSALMEPILQEFHEAAGRITFRTAQLPLISNIDGRPRHEISADYLRDHLRGTVRFHDCLSYFAEEKVAVIEIGPGGLIKMARRHIRGDHVWGASLGKEGQDWEVLHRSLALLADRGIPLNWKGYYTPLQPAYAPLPPYSFNRREYWMEEDKALPAPPDSVITETVLPSEILDIMNHHLETIHNQSEYMLKRG